MRKDTVITINYDSVQEANEAIEAVIQVGPELISDEQMVNVWTAMTTGVGHFQFGTEYVLCPICAGYNEAIEASGADSEDQNG